MSPYLNYPVCPDSGHFESDTQAAKSGGFFLCFSRYVAEAQPCALLLSWFFFLKVTEESLFVVFVKNGGNKKACGRRFLGLASRG